MKTREAPAGAAACLRMASFRTAVRGLSGPIRGRFHAGRGQSVGKTKRACCRLSHLADTRAGRRRRQPFGWVAVQGASNSIGTAPHPLSCSPFRRPFYPVDMTAVWRQYEVFEARQRC